MSFDPADGDADGVPDTVDLALPPDWSASVAFNAADADGELDVALFDTPPFTALSSGVIAQITLGVTCEATSEVIVEPLPFSSSPAPSFGGTDGQSVAGTFDGGSIDILPGLRGDCNGDGEVDAGDLTACGLEVFDGDGDFWLDVPGGSFPGLPVGCDANADTQVDAGDLACKILLLFGGTCGGKSLQPPSPPALDDGGSESRAGGGVVVPISLDPRGHELIALAFSLDLAPGVTLDPTDSDGDGVPDDIRVLWDGNVRSVVYDPTDFDGEIDVILGDLAATPDRLPHGRLLEIHVDAGPVPGASVLSLATDPAPSAGTSSGSSVAVGVSTALFADGFESGTTQAWGSSVP